MGDQPDYANKIAGLLAKAEDPAATPAEAEAFSRKAEELMVKWGISDAMIAAKRSGEEMRQEKIVEHRHKIHHRYYQAEVMLINSIAQGVGTVRLLKRDEYNHTSYVYLIGYESDLLRVETLWHSLWLQANTAMKKWWREYKQTAEGQARTKSSLVFKDRREFLLSFGYAVRTRLRDMYRKEEQAGEPGTAVALVDRGQQVNDALKQMYPHTKSSRGMQTSGSWAGHTAGSKAGKNADLGNRNVGTGRAGELGR